MDEGPLASAVLAQAQRHLNRFRRLPQKGAYIHHTHYNLLGRCGSTSDQLTRTCGSSSALFADHSHGCVSGVSCCGRGHLPGAKCLLDQILTKEPASLASHRVAVHRCRVDAAQRGAGEGQQRQG